MSLLQKTNRVKVLLSYSDEHRKAMKEAREVACQSLADQVRDVIEKELHGKITKVYPLGKGFADLLIEADILSEKLKQLETSMEKIDKEVGAEKVYLFANSE